MKMSEQISALIDDEIAAEDAMHIITSMQSQKQAAEAWQYYHLIGDVMRGDAAFSKDFKQNLIKKLMQKQQSYHPLRKKLAPQFQIQLL